MKLLLAFLSILNLQLVVVAFQPTGSTHTTASPLLRKSNEINKRVILQNQANENDIINTNDNRRSFVNKLLMGTVGSVFASSNSMMTNVANAAEEGNGLVDVYFGVGTFLFQ